MKRAKDIALDMLEDVARFTMLYIEPLLIGLWWVLKILLIAFAGVMILWGIKWLWTHLPV